MKNNKIKDYKAVKLLLVAKDDQTQRVFCRNVIEVEDAAELLLQL